MQHVITKEEIAAINALCGMELRPGSYTPDYWYKLVGVNPSDYPKLVKIIYDRCHWTEYAQNVYNAIRNKTRSNYAAIGVNS